MVYSRTDRETGTARRRVLRGNRGERGIALVVALVMLALLGILGAMALYTSTTELRIAGNYRLAQDAFFVADAAIEYAFADQKIYLAITPDSGPAGSWPQKGKGNSPNNNNYNTVVFNGPTGERNPADIRVEWQACGEPPAGSGASHEAALNSDKARTNYFLINVEGSVWNSEETHIAVEALGTRPAARCVDDM